MVRTRDPAYGGSGSPQGFRRRAAGILIIQFIGECVVYFRHGRCSSTTMMAELSLPAIRHAVDRPAPPSTSGRDPVLLRRRLLGPSASGWVCSRAPYPGAGAVTISNPRLPLKGGWSASPGGSALRQTLVAMQFVILVLLIFAVLVIGRQNHGLP